MIIEILESSKIITTHFDGKKAKYFHLKISNKRKVISKGTRILITKFHTIKNGTCIDKGIVGSIPLNWQLSCIDPILYPPLRAIGPYQICDIGYLVEGDNFFLITTPLNLPETRLEMKANTKVRMEIIASAENAQSKPFYLQLEWDGKWDDDPVKIEEHLKVKQIDPF